MRDLDNPAEQEAWERDKRELGPPSYTPHDWYWEADDGRLFSSSRLRLVQIDDPAFLLWTRNEHARCYFNTLSREPTVWPRDNCGQQTVAALIGSLAIYGIGVSA